MNKREKRTETIVVRVTPTEKARIAKAAEEDLGGVSMSTFLRVYTLQYERALRAITIKDCKLYFELICCECDGDFSATIPLSGYPGQIDTDLRRVGIPCPECGYDAHPIITKVQLLLPETPLSDEEKTQGESK